MASKIIEKITEKITEKIYLFVISTLTILMAVPKKILSTKYLLLTLFKIGLVSFNSKSINNIVLKLLDNFGLSSPKIIKFVSGIITGISSSNSIENTVKMIIDFIKKFGIIKNQQHLSDSSEVSGNNFKTLVEVLLYGLAGIFTN